MKQFLLLAFCIVALQGISLAQLGGSRTYEFLEQSPSARVTALGGINITTIGEDISFQLANPATLNASQHRHLAFTTAIYPAGINFGNASYVTKFKVPGTFGFGIQYVAYGKFKQTNTQAEELGTFSAGEMNAYAGYAYQFGKIFSVGANAKFIYSQLYNYSSVGMAADLAFTVNDTAHRITASLVAKNIGGQFKPYRSGNNEPVPFDLQAGLSVGFKFIPLRLSMTLHHLYTWDIRYNDPNDQPTDNLFTDSSNTKPKQYIADKIFRHIIFSAELTIKKVVRLEVAYNHLRQQELKLETKRGAPGLSFGLGIHVKQFDFTYGFQPMGQGQTLNQFTLQVNTAGFVKKIKAPKE